MACRPQQAGADVGAQLQKSFIWLASAPTGTQAYVVFRKEFALREKPRSAKLHLFADTRYILWVNGQTIARGPCRFDPQAPEYDTLDIVAALRPGANVLAILVHHLHDGKPTQSPDELNGRSMRHAPGLTAWAEIVEPDGKRHTLRTDGAWRASKETRFLPEWTGGVWASIHDRIDARRDRGDWSAPGFDDALWETATPIDGTQWGPLHSRAIPLLQETAFVPESLRRDGNRVSLPLEIQAGQNLLVDAGRMTIAYDILEMDAEEGSEIEVRHGHGLTHGELEEVYNFNRYIARAGRQTYMSGDTRGFRYMTIRVKTGRVTLRGLRLVERRYPFAIAGRFDSNDPFLNELWARSVRTVVLCSEDGYEDCNSRERTEWMGDAALVEYPVTQSALAGPNPDGSPRYADPRLIRNMLRHIAQSRLPDGRLKAHHPSNRFDIHGYIEDYACLWVVTLRRYYEATGDRTLVRELWPSLTGQMRWFLDRRTADGLIRAREFLFFDNPLSYKVCEGTTLNACIAGALRDSARLAQVLGKSAQSSLYAQAAQDLTGAINRNLFDAASGAYFGAVLNGKKTEPTAHAAMLALYFDIVPSERRASVLAWLVAHRQQVGTPYTLHFLLAALFRADTDAMDRLALATVRERWASTLARKDVDTVFEGFGNGSLCHNMGAASACFLSGYVLGVRREEPVWKRRIVLAPHLGDLARAEGVVVTEFGPVSVSWKREGDSLRYRVTVPAGVRASLILRRGPKRLLDSGTHSGLAPAD